MKRSTTIRLTNNLVIFILTGIIYVFMEVFATSVLMPGMIEKYHFNPLKTTYYQQMTFKPREEEITEDFVYLTPIQRLSLIGASSIWMFVVGGLSGLCLYLLYNLLKKKWNLFFLCITGSLIITAWELTSGILLNGVLKLFIWDYTLQFLNLWGQICLTHSLLYIFIICPIAYWFFHFLESQYPEYDQKTYSLFSHYVYLFLPHEENIDKMIKKIREKKKRM